MLESIKYLSVLGWPLFKVIGLFAYLFFILGIIAVIFKQFKLPFLFHVWSARIAITLATIHILLAIF